jgi:glycine hydroxymethyltransferase
MAAEFVKRGYHVISNGTDNHSMLIDLRAKDVTGKEAEKALEKAGITVNKNMVPFDDKSPFVTSGMRVGTPAVTTRGLKKDDMPRIVEFIDQVLTDTENEEKIAKIKADIRDWMSPKPLYQS